MSAARSLWLSSRCSNCQYAALSVFASLAGVSLRSQPCATRVNLNRSPSGARPYSVSTPRFTDSPLRTQPLLPESNHEETAEKSIISASDELTINSPRFDGPSATDTFVPWYLQEQVTEETETPLLERQKLPDLPPNPPNLLAPILDHLSKEIGLDYLTLLDLRGLDPPPALGSNLIMLLGTARSEKHLHVSADRFARWLRTEHKLSPYADGLLGRNELKLKLRRKARRAKLLGSSKMSRSSEEDDGIRTGWVCVNVGSIEEAQGVEGELSLEKDGAIGFGGRQDGVRLVVQMLTEEKRESLDLESLWAGFVRRQQKKEEIAERDIAGISEKARRSASSDEVGHVTSYAFAQVADSQPLPNSRTQMAGLRSYTQTRKLHTSTARLVHAERMKAPPKGKTANKTSNDSASTARPQNMSGPRDFQRVTGATGLLDHIAALKKKPKPEILTSLGEGSEDRSSTPFLEQFYGLIPLFAQVEHFHARFVLMRLAMDVGHPGYKASSMVQLLAEMQEGAIEIPVGIFKTVIRAIVDEADADADAETVKDDSSSAPLARLSQLIDILEDMQLRGLPALSPFVLDRVTHIFRLAQQQQQSAKEGSDSGSTPPTPPPPSEEIISAARRLSRLRLYSFTTPIANFALDKLLLSTFAAANQWGDHDGGFWSHWRIFPLRMEARPAELYVCMWHLVAATGSQRRAIKALADWVAEMERERPRVELDKDAEVAGAVLECVKVADPEAERQVKEGLNPMGQYVRLWKRCAAAGIGGSVR